MKINKKLQNKLGKNKWDKQKHKVYLKMLLLKVKTNLVSL